MSHHGNRRQHRGAHEGERLSPELFANFIERLKVDPGRRRLLLDHSLIVYGSGMSDGNGHTGSPLPMAVIVGGGAGN